MPPKKATPAPVAAAATSGGGKEAVVNEVGIGLSASLYATTTTLPFKGLTVKLFCHHNIIETSSSPVFGEALAWTDIALNDTHVGNADGGDDALTSSSATKRSPIQVATYTWPNVDLSTILKDTDKMIKFHGASGIYAVLMGKRTDIGDDSEVPIAFAYVDCSIFMLEGGKSSGRSQSIDGGLLLELTVTAVHPQVPKETAFTYDPLILQISQLGGYPVLIGDSPVLCCAVLCCAVLCCVNTTISSSSSSSFSSPYSNVLLFLHTPFHRYPQLLFHTSSIPHTFSSIYSIALPITHILLYYSYLFCYLYQMRWKVKLWTPCMSMESLRWELFRRPFSFDPCELCPASQHSLVPWVNCEEVLLEV